MEEKKVCCICGKEFIVIQCYGASRKSCYPYAESWRLFIDKKVIVMVYWSASEAERMPVVMDAVLQKYFPEKTWGAIPLINKDGVVELVTIDRVEYTGGGRHGDETEWTHYANIQLYDGDVWELNEQFKGKNEDEMWIYGYYKSFGSAVRNLATKGTKDRKPIKIWM